MATFTWTGFYPAQFNTPEGSAIVAPGQRVQWPDDGLPNEGHGWVETPDEEPTPFEELGIQEEPREESEQDSGENMPENTPALTEPVAEPAAEPADTPADEKPADTVSPQVTDTDTGDTTDQPDSTPAAKRRAGAKN